MKSMQEIIPTAELKCACGIIAFGAKESTHIKEHIQKREIDGKFYCSSCDHSDTNAYSFLHHCKKTSHKARRHYVHCLSLTNNPKFSYETVSFLYKKLGDKKIQRICSELSYACGMMREDPDLKKELMERLEKMDSSWRK